MSARKPLHILGDGCAGLSLAAHADKLSGYEMTVISPTGAPETKEHIWGFWQIAGLEAAAKCARHKWTRWSIKTPAGEAVMQSQLHSYHALQRSRWEGHCRDRAQENGVKFAAEKDVAADPRAQILDSRPQACPKDQMVQHFIGWEVRAMSGGFDPDTAILMDFRCDQSRGIHFLYILPFSQDVALVESTMFAPQREPDSFFEAAIAQYLSAECGISSFSLAHVEHGAIPLGRLPENPNGLTGIGGNGGAIRPSSGYAFAFIQKQIARAVAKASKLPPDKTPADLPVKSPHMTVDLLMDDVFLHVLRTRPDIAPSLFLRMGSALSGDEFALFLSGEASWVLRLKVIMLMPKWVFVRAALACLQMFLFNRHSRHK